MFELNRPMRPANAFAISAALCSTLRYFLPSNSARSLAK
jgi:hypothetical protein